MGVRNLKGKLKRRKLSPILEFTGVDTLQTQQVESLPVAITYTYIRRTTAGVSSETFPVGGVNQAWDLLHATVSVIKTVSAGLTTGVEFGLGGYFSKEFYFNQAGSYNLVIDLKGITVFSQHTLHIDVTTNACDLLAVVIIYNQRTVTVTVP